MLPDGNGFSDGSVYGLWTAQPTIETKLTTFGNWPDAAWQLDLADMLRCIAKDYDERAEYIETRQVRAMASQGRSFTTGQ